MLSQDEGTSLPVKDCNLREGESLVGGGEARKGIQCEAHRRMKY